MQVEPSFLHSHYLFLIFFRRFYLCFQFFLSIAAVLSLSLDCIASCLLSSSGLISCPSLLFSSQSFLLICSCSFLSLYLLLQKPLLLCLKPLQHLFRDDGSLSEPLSSISQKNILSLNGLRQSKIHMLLNFKTLEAYRYQNFIFQQNISKQEMYHYSLSLYIFLSDGRQLWQSVTLSSRSICLMAH